MKRYDNESILAFGCTHAPYHHKDSLDFLRDINDFYQPDRVVHLGDILDIYSVSDYPKDISHKDTWTDELKKGRKFVQDLAKIFPVLDMMDSNHDSRAYKKSRVSGIPREFLVKYMDVIGAPEGWKLKPELRLTVDSTRDHWLFAHIKNGGALQCAKALNTSVCLGHQHTKFSCAAFDNGRKTIWGVESGCLISDKGSPFKYNKTQTGRPIQGAFMILSGTPIPLPIEVK